MPAVVFISHSSADREIADRLCGALERRGVACWLASRDIGPGENFQESIVKAIRAARAMVLVFTGNANNSDEIKKELALASQGHLVVVPLRVEDVTPSDAFLYEFSTRQWIDAYDDWERAIDRLARQVGEITREHDSGTPPSPAPADQARRAVPWKPRTRILSVAAAVAIVVAGGLTYWIAANPGTPTPSRPAANAVPAVKHDVSGKWVTGELTNPYDRNQTSTLQFDFQQSGETLFGTVRENGRFGSTHKGIHGGQIKGDFIVFFTQGVTTTGTGEQPYKEHYRGTLKAGVITFVRQNDVASGGLPQNFTARRE